MTTPRGTLQFCEPRIAPEHLEGRRTIFHENTTFTLGRKTKNHRGDSVFIHQDSYRTRGPISYFVVNPTMSGPHGKYRTSFQQAQRRLLYCTIAIGGASYVVGRRRALRSPMPCGLPLSIWSQPSKERPKIPTPRGDIVGTPVVRKVHTSCGEEVHSTDAFHLPREEGTRTVFSRVGARRSRREVHTRLTIAPSTQFEPLVISTTPRHRTRNSYMYVKRH